MRPDERERQAHVMGGGTVVANRTPTSDGRVDGALIDWAKSEGCYQYVGRQPGNPWGNPFVVGRSGDRETCIAKYTAKLMANPELLARVPELRGKVLGCSCYPEPCHGDVLAELADREAVA